MSRDRSSRLLRLLREFGILYAPTPAELTSTVGAMRRFTRRVTRHALSVIAGFGLNATACGGPPGSECGTKLTLDLIGARPLPDAARPVGLRASDTGVVVYWKDSSLTWLSKDSSAAEIRLGGQVLGAAIQPGDSVVTTLVGFENGNAQEILVNARGQVTARRELGRFVAPAEAIHVDGIWLVAEHPDSLSWQVRRAGAEAVLFSGRRDPAREPARGFLRLSEGDPGHAMVTRRAWPFEVEQIDVVVPSPSTTLGRIAMTSQLEALGLERHWVSLPTLPVACGSLQLLADRTSDRRLVVLRDDRGVVVRVTPINAPLGFVQSRPADHLLIAVRTLEGEEVASYRWTVTK